MLKGRLSRSNYWIWLVGIIAAKIALRQLLGSSSSNIGMGLDVMLLGIMIARFHDFDLPAWSAVTLWVGLAIVLPVMLLIAAGGKSQQLIGLASLPVLLAHVVIGFIPGNRGTNSYGKPGQGLAGANRQSGDPDPASLRASRIAAVTRTR